MSTRGREGGLVRFGYGELMLTAMADAHGMDVCSRTDTTVAVNRSTALASRPYSDDGPKERKVGGAVVMAGPG